MTEAKRGSELPTLRVRGGDPKSPDTSKRPTDPLALARSIVKALASSDVVLVKSIGKVSEATTMKAFRIASLEFRRTSEKNLELLVKQTEFKADDGVSWGVCTRIFPVPAEHVR
jgi:hypothetical protein